MATRGLKESYRFYYPDFDRHKNLSEIYPDLEKIYKQPIAFWFGRSNKKPLKRIEGRIARLLERAHHNTVVLVIYSIPNRDIGGYSTGGELDEEHYIEFITKINNGIREFTPIVIFEPDAIPHMNTMESGDSTKRLKLINRALSILRQSNAKIYVDIGHPNWLEVDESIKLLKKIDKNGFDGFSLNVSNFIDTDECLEYGIQINKKIKKSFVIDTSRNGLGFTNSIYNPDNISIGEYPTTNTGNESCDAFLWIKPIGESDGTKNGGPKAGRFYLKNILKIIEKSKKIGIL